MRIKNVTNDFIHNTGIFMQKGFEGNKTQLIEREKQRFLDTNDSVNVWDLRDQCELVSTYKRENDNYNMSRALAILDAMCEIVNGKGVEV